MDTLPLTAATTTNVVKFPFSIPCQINPKNCRNLGNQQRKFLVFAAKDDNKLGNWDQMELKFDKLIGENPKLTLAKIKDRNSDPEHNKVKRPKEPLVKVPNVILWNANSFEEDDDVPKMSSSLSLKPNLSLKMGAEKGREHFSDMILVKNPEPMMKNETDNSSRFAFDDMNNSSRNLELMSENQERGEVLKLQKGGHEKHLLKGSQSSAHGDIEKNFIPKIAANSSTKPSLDATLQQPPKRLDQHVKEIFDNGGRITRIQNLITNAATIENFPSILHSKDREDMDWKRAQDLILTTGRGEVELISCSTRGFVVSFGSLIGFLPYRNLATNWKFLAFESWLRRKGVDPATYRKSLGIIGSFDAISKATTFNTNVDCEKIEWGISSHMKLEDLLAIYDQEKLEYLSTFVGQRIKVNVILANRESKKLIFSVKPKEKEESIQKKRNLMAKLNVGDIVSCCIKKISYFGIFVEVEEVPALIHQTEVSWDATLNPASSFKIGQVVEAKVHQLDFSLERISLSLKEIMPDPLTDALEAVLGDHSVSNDNTLQAELPENEWDDLDSLVEELQQYEGIEVVTKGRFFLSPGLTPTFQVYMASMFKNQYKLLARAGNKVQEVVVQTSLSTEEMKYAILTCTNRVE